MFWSRMLFLSALVLWGGIASGQTSTETASNEARAIARMHAANQSETAEAAVEIASEEIMALIRRGQVYAKDDPDRFFTEVEQLLQPVVDFPRFARSVMGVWYKRANDEQRQRFAESFKWTLVRSYALALTEFYDGQVRVLPNRRESKNPNRATVNMEITYRDKPYSVVYAMERRGQKWGLVNIVIEGINLRLNYRSQFDSAMKGPKFGRDLETVLQAWSNVIVPDSE
ncbi:MAG: phospholipid transport system substrate-binding protein [Limisphaerales bacterium]|jgi:phospholipid transport system substrate-binding protein